MPKPLGDFTNNKSIKMANTSRSSRALPWVLLLIASLSHIPESSAELACEDLSVEYCAFSISTSAKRCVLEQYLDKERNKEYECKTSEVVVEKTMSAYIETDKCVRACGVDRKTVGISSDALLEPHFMAGLCSPACFRNCPNIVDLYSNLASGEGGNLPVLCEKQRREPRRAMVELKSSGAAAGPVVSAEFSEGICAPSASPVATPGRPFVGFSL